jgi:sporulation protein YlmC with PRC-barrel domain
MAHYGLLRGYRFDDEGTANDIRGANVYGRNDEKLGKIDDVIFDHSTGVVRYVVVDTRGWFSHKRFLVPPHRLHSVAEHDDDFAVNLDKSQIETLPRYNEEDLQSEEKWKPYEKQYDAAWHAGPVQHRRGSDHDVTPTPDEMPDEPGAIGSQLNPQEPGKLSSRVIPAGSDAVMIQSSAMGIGPRWANFESRLRQHRRDITESCPTCTVGPASDRAAESVENERKAV